MVIDCLCCVVFSFLDLASLAIVFVNEFDDFSFLKSSKHLDLSLEMCRWNCEAKANEKGMGMGVFGLDWIVVLLR